MSIRLMTVVWDVQFPTQAQKLIALKLADYASDSGNSVYPSNESLARKAGCDERTVQRTLKAFRDCGILRLVRQGGNGPKDTNEWQLDVDLLRSLSEDRAAISGSSTALEINDIHKGDMMGDRLSPIEPLRVTSDRLRVTPASSKGDTSVTQSVTNHQLDPSGRASARSEVLKSGLGSEGNAASRALPIFTITPADTSWSHWTAELESRGHKVSETLRAIKVSARFPKPDSVVFEPHWLRGEKRGVA